MLPEAIISHHTARRLRLHIPKHKRDATFFARIRDELARCEGVERVEANPSTGSVLIHHRSTLGTIAQFAETAKLFAVAVEEAPLNPTSLATRVTNGVSKLNRQLVTATHGAMDLTSISALGLTIGGVIRGVMCKKKFLPGGGDMIWWAITLLARHDVRVRETSASSAPARRERERKQIRRKRILRARR